jgi:peptide/nickel transport system permease protein
MLEFGRDARPRADQALGAKASNSTTKPNRGSRSWSSTIVRSLPIGLPPEIPTWGNLMIQAESYLTSNPILVIAPGAVVTLTVAAVFFIGDALRDALDVRAR